MKQQAWEVNAYTDVLSTYIGAYNPPSFSPVHRPPCRRGRFDAAAAGARGAAISVKACYSDWFIAGFCAICLWAGLHAQSVFWRWNCGRCGSSGIPVPSQSSSPRHCICTAQWNAKTISSKFAAAKIAFHIYGTAGATPAVCSSLQSVSGIAAVRGRRVED